MMDAARWYAVMVGGSAGFYERRRVVPEFRAVERMGDEGYEAFCPTASILTRPRRGQRLRERLIVPLWDGYVFAALDDRALGLRLPRWPDVHDVIRRNGQPYALCADLVASLRAVDQALAYTDVTGTPAAIVEQILAVGDVVEHRGSAFDGVRGRISRVDRDNIEIVVRLMFGAERTVRAKARDVALVEG